MSNPPRFSSVQRITLGSLVAEWVERFHVARLALWCSVWCDRCDAEGPRAEHDRAAVTDALREGWRQVKRPDAPDPWLCPRCYTLHTAEAKADLYLQEAASANRRYQRESDANVTLRRGIERIAVALHTIREASDDHRADWSSEQETKSFLAEIEDDAKTLYDGYHAQGRAFEAVCNALNPDCDPLATLAETERETIARIREYQALAVELREERDDARKRVQIKHEGYVSLLTERDAAVAKKEAAQAEARTYERHLCELAKLTGTAAGDDTMDPGRAQLIVDTVAQLREERASLETAVGLYRTERDRAREDLAAEQQRRAIVENFLNNLRAGYRRVCPDCQGSATTGGQSCTTCTTPEGMPRFDVLGFVRAEPGDALSAAKARADLESARFRLLDYARARGLPVQATSDLAAIFEALESDRGTP